MTRARLSALALSTGLLACSALLLKLFTLEFYFADDPTSGVALRSTPGFGNRQLVNDSRMLKGRILVEDENGFLGEGLYRGVVGWAWLPLAVGAGILGVQARRRRRES